MLLQFVDTVWAEFCLSDDQIVHHTDLKNLDGNFILGNSHKKPRHEVISIEDRSAATYVGQ